MPPEYEWIEKGKIALVYDWIGGSSYAGGDRVVCHRYSVTEQQRHCRKRFLGEIEKVGDRWIANGCEFESYGEAVLSLLEYKTKEKELCRSLG